MKKYHVFLIVLIPGLLATVWVAKANDSKQESTPGVHFYFTQITDTHLDQADHAERTVKVVEAINKLPMKIECVVHTGDILMDSIENPKHVDKSLRILSGLKVPIHYVAGNHDILKRNNKIQKTAEIYKKRYGPLCYTKEYQGVVFVFIFTNPIAEQYSLEGYDVLRQLKETLEEARDKPVIIFHHIPSVEDFFGEKIYPGWRTDIRKRWNALVNAYNVKGVISGHFHRDELHWIGKVPLYVSPPVAGYWERQATYRIYEYRNGKIGYRTQYIQMKKK